MVAYQGWGESILNCIQYCCKTLKTIQNTSFPWALKVLILRHIKKRQQSFKQMVHNWQIFIVREVLFKLGCISHEREWLLDFGNGNGKWQIPFPFFGNGNPSGKFQSNFREREREWKFHKIPFPFSGTGMRVKNSIPIFGNGNESEKFHSRLSGRELEDGFPGNSREFQGIPGIGNSRDIAIANLLPLVSELVSFRFLVSLHTA